MQVSRDDLADTFRELSDEELLQRIKAGTLTEMALDVAATELRFRGLKMPKMPVTAKSVAAEQEETEEEGDDSEIDLVTVARFSNPLQASVLRACLESHGIQVYLWGEHLGTAHIFLSIVAGGLRVQVPRSQVAQAREVIAAWERGELAIDDVPE